MKLKTGTIDPLSYSWLNCCTVDLQFSLRPNCLGLVQLERVNFSSLLTHDKTLRIDQYRFESFEKCSVSSFSDVQAMLFSDCWLELRFQNLPVLKSVTSFTVFKTC